MEAEDLSFSNDAPLDRAEEERRNAERERNVARILSLLEQRPTNSEQETEALKELNEFLSKPRSIGLDNVKESLRNVVELWLEVGGYSTGRDLQHLVHGEHSTLAMAGMLPKDRERKKREELARALEDFEQIMKLCFTEAYESVQQRITDIKTGIDLEIDKLDRAIEEEADTEAEAEEMKAKSSKRRKLKRFKKHIKEHEAELKDADTTQEIISVEKNIVEDMHDFKAGRFNPTHRPDPLFPVSDILQNAALALPALALSADDPRDDVFDLMDDNKNNKKKKAPFSSTTSASVHSNTQSDSDGRNGTGDTGSGDSGKTGETDSAGSNDEDTQPPPPFEP